MIQIIVLEREQWGKVMGSPMPTQYKVGSIMEMDCLMLH